MARTNHEQSIWTAAAQGAATLKSHSRETAQARRWSMRRKLKVGYSVLGAVVLTLVVGLVAMSAVGGNHTLRSVTYAQVPPHSGDHSPVWQHCGFYSEPIGSEHAVHSLEHGVVWITYQPDLPADQVETLRQLARADDYLIVSPYPDLPAPVVVSAWEQQLQLASAGDPRLKPKVADFRNSPLAPEPDGGCDGPNLWFSGGAGDPER
jgi:hypothetical protein